MFKPSQGVSSAPEPIAPRSEDLRESYFNERIAEAERTLTQKLFFASDRAAALNQDQRVTLLYVFDDVYGRHPPSKSRILNSPRPLETIKIEDLTNPHYRKFAESLRRRGLEPEVVRGDEDWAISLNIRPANAADVLLRFAAEGSSPLVRQGIGVVHAARKIFIETGEIGEVLTKLSLNLRTLERRFQAAGLSFSDKVAEWRELRCKSTITDIAKLLHEQLLTPPADLAQRITTLDAEAAHCPDFERLCVEHYKRAVGGSQGSGETRIALATSRLIEERREALTPAVESLVRRLEIAPEAQVVLVRSLVYQEGRAQCGKALGKSEALISATRTKLCLRFPELRWLIGVTSRRQISREEGELHQLEELRPAVEDSLPKFLHKAWLKFCRAQLSHAASLTQEAGSALAVALPILKQALRDKTILSESAWLISVSPDMRKHPEAAARDLLALYRKLVDPSKEVELPNYLIATALKRIVPISADFKEKRFAWPEDRIDKILAELQAQKATLEQRLRDRSIPAILQPGIIRRCLRQPGRHSSRERRIIACALAGHAALEKRVKKEADLAPEVTKRLMAQAIQSSNPVKRFEKLLERAKKQST